MMKSIVFYCETDSLRSWRALRWLLFVAMHITTALLHLINLHHSTKNLRERSLCTPLSWQVSQMLIKMMFVQSWKLVRVMDNVDCKTDSLRSWRALCFIVKQIAWMKSIVMIVICCNVDHNSFVTSNQFTALKKP